MAKYRCTVCNWAYNEEKEGKKFSELPDSYTCPICGSPKSAFVPEGITKEDESIDTTVADKIVEQLVALNVTHIYGIPGDSNLPLIDAIRKTDAMHFVLTRHEETAAFMASAHGKMTDHIGVCISIAGPGSTNLVTGLVDAATDRSPVLAFTGQVPEIYLGSEAFQEIDQLDIFKPFAHYTEVIARTNQALNVLTMAAKYAYKKPGVSVLSTPTDVLVEKLGETIHAPDKRIFSPDVEPKEDALQKAADRINDSERPVLFAGWGARHAGALLMEIAEKLHAPIATTSRAKGIINEAHDLSLGVLGSIGSKHASQAIKNSDLIVIIGSGFRQANLVPADIPLIQIDIDPTRIGKTFDIAVGIVGDAKQALQKLAPLLEEKPPNGNFLAAIHSIKQKHVAELQSDATNTSVPIYPGYVIQALKRHVADDAIICVDVGDHTYWFYKKFICEGQRTYMSANVASMGFAFPASLSAKIDYPDRQVVCVTGDGGFAMLMADFTTAVRENLAVTIVVFNDGKLKNIKKEQERDHFPEFGVSFPNPDFAAFARTAGGEGYRVEKPNDLDDALQQALSSDKPVIVDVVVDPDAMAAATKHVE